ncbi:aldo/keto reductase [Sinomonas humi]|uniref:2,5-diketo-D-gluconic acid reductase n=1 Tax=Sinomonas humi TaxID=1338436 RepID=A0A0B2AU68_9MICC|nr:aldo/keto reductase [Sinomonas humi]KHL05435.1 2,5-diketo-D-gluconic acid reductase [Sinomonas humi]
MGQPGAVSNISLNNGVEIPQLGFGVFQVPSAETQAAVEAALEAGYRHIDTAAAYQNEAGVGAALRATGIAREDVFVTTKLRNGEQDTPRAAFDASRRALGLDVIDLYLIHWPVPSRDLYAAAWKELERIYAQGEARSIGVSNFLPEHLDRLLGESDVVPAVNQIELHPTFQQPATAQRTREAGIAVEAYSPLGQGRDLAADPVAAAARAHEATPAQVVLAWHLAHGTIVIPKTTSAERMRENFAAATLDLTAEEVSAIDALDSDARIGSDPATAAHTQMPQV